MTDQTRPDIKRVFVDNKRGYVDAFEAVKLITREWVEAGSSCQETTITLRDALLDALHLLTAEPATGEGAKAEFREWLYSELPGTSIFKDAAIADKAAEIFAVVRDKGPDYVAGLKQMIARQDAEIAKLNRDMEREERDHLGTIDHRDQHEERINAIVRELGLGEYESSWTSHNDPSERAIEEINSLQQNSLKWREWAVKELSDVANALEEDDDNELRRKLSVVLAELAEEATPHPAIIEGRGQVVTDGQNEALKRWSEHLNRADESRSPYYAGTFNQNEQAQIQLATDMRILADLELATFPPRPAFNPPPKPEQTIELTLQAPIGSAVHWKTLGGKEHVGKLIEWDSNVAIVKTEQGVKAVEC